MKIFRGFLFAIIIAGLAIPLMAQTVNKVVAIVNEEVITQQDVEQLKSVLYAQYAQEYTGDELLQKMEELKKDLLKQMIEDKLILSRAKELKVRVGQEEMEDKLERIKQGFPSEEAFNDTLSTQGITVADLKQRYKDQIMMKKLVEFEIKSKINVLPSEITEYYEKNREDFKMDEKYRVRHLLIKAQDDVSFDLAKVEMTDIYKRLKQGQDFAELAKQYSQDPNKEQGGDMGYVSRGTMLKELEDIIFSLKPGELSPPIKSKVGYHMFKIEDIMHSGYLSVDEAKNKIEAVMFQKKLKEKLEKWIDELKSKAYISVK